MNEDSNESNEKTKSKTKTNTEIKSKDKNEGSKKKIKEDSVIDTKPSSPRGLQRLAADNLSILDCLSAFTDPERLTGL